MKNLRNLVLIALTFGLIGFPKVFADSQLPLRTVDFVDLDRYLGTWYEIASIPQLFQQGCKNSTADYSPHEEANTITVTNTCTRFGQTSSVNGTAEVIDLESYAKLEVQFFWPFKGDYWIIELDPNYQWAVVGEPSRKNLWILSREKVMNEDLIANLMQRIETVHSYDTSLIKKSIRD